MLLAFLYLMPLFIRHIFMDMWTKCGNPFVMLCIQLYIYVNFCYKKRTVGLKVKKVKSTSTRVHRQVLISLS